MRYLSYPSLLWPCASKALSWACSKAALHGSWSCNAYSCSASNPYVICHPHPESALSPSIILTLPRLPYIYPYLPLYRPCLGKPPNNSSTHEYIRETLTPGPHVFFFVFLCFASRRLGHNASRSNIDNHSRTISGNKQVVSK